MKVDDGMNVCDAVPEQTAPVQLIPKAPDFLYICSTPPGTYTFSQ